MRIEQVSRRLRSLCATGSLLLALCAASSCTHENPQSTASAGRKLLRFEVVPALVPECGNVTLEGYDLETADVRMRAGVLSDGTAGKRILFMDPTWGPHDISVFVCDGASAAAEGPRVVIEALWSGSKSSHETREIHAGAGAFGSIRANRPLDNPNGALVVQFAVEVETGADDYRRSINGDAVVKPWP
ncbi:MAG: hypothetical protein HUU28_05030 [Planctomycetaceae bacterium]|nr:hypothetical protein [Planctomycetaceae bacterium]